MPIKNLTNRRHSDDTGKPVRLGFLQKGWREGFGKKIKLHDADYFIFKPAGNDHASEKMHQIFKRVYGEQPREIPDVRIPVGIAGNFNIADHAWLTAHKHTEQGSVFLARSDGDNIKQARDPRNGKVKFYYDGEMPHAENVTVDGRGNDCYDYQGRLYPFTQQMMIDLTLPAFNRALYQEGLAGSGVVTLITHATWDIANLIDEYNAILDEVMGVYNDGSRSPNVVKNWLPLRDIPLRLFRSEDKITTPAWKPDANPGDRYSDTRDLVHWQLNPEFAAAVQHARDQRTQLTLQAIAQAPLLMAGQAANSAADRLALANRDFFDVPLELGDGEPAGEDEPATGPDWEALSELDQALEGELVEDDDSAGDDDGEGDSRKPADLAAELYQGQLFQNAFDDEAHLVRGINFILGELAYDAMFDHSLTKALTSYANSVADGATVRDAIEAARKQYQDAVAMPF
ncbi:MAG: hypothetical protein KDK05_10430 [Candidatus Competibacteraceae bacterium]|nr:hypothetical protein [Candidatus Competibacteraceae bacterium]